MKVCIDTPLTLIAMALAIFISITLSSRHSSEHDRDEAFKQTKAAFSYNHFRKDSGYTLDRNDWSARNDWSDGNSWSGRANRSDSISRLSSAQAMSDQEPLRFSSIGNYNLSVSQQRLLELWGLTE